MMSISTAHNSINLKAQCAEGLFQKKSTYVEKVSVIRTKKRHTVYSEQVLQKTWVLRHLWNLELRRGICFPDKLSQSTPELGAKWKKSSETKFFCGCTVLCVFSQQDLNEEKLVVSVHSCVEAQHLVLAAGQHSPLLCFEVNWERLSATLLAWALHCPNRPSATWLV